MHSPPASLTRRGMLFGMASAALANVQPRNRMYNPELAAHSFFWLAESALENRRLGDVLDEAFMCLRRDISVSS